MDAKTVIEKLKMKDNGVFKIGLLAEEVNQIIDFIEQQAKQIQDMRTCDNCEHEFVAYYKEPCDSCNNFENWEWDGGNNGS